MKILHVINTLDYGGAECLLFNFANHVHKSFSEVELEVCTLLKEGSLGKKLKETGIKLHNLSISKWNVVEAVYKLANLIKKRSYVIVHAHLFPTLYYVGFAKYILHISRIRNNSAVYIYTEHSTYNRRRKHYFFRKFEEIIYDCYDAIVANSIDTQNAIIEWTPKLKKKIYVIENAIPIPNCFKRNYQISNPPKLLFVGRLVYAKGADIAIDAVKILKKRGIAVKLTIVGDGPEKTKLQKKAMDLNVEFIGANPNPTELMCKHDILLVPSRWEGFGLVAVEGMAVGIPVIASAVGGLKRIIKHKETGFMFEPENTHVLAKYIEYLINNYKLRKKIGYNGRKYAVERWSLGKYVGETLKLYSALLKLKK